MSDLHKTRSFRMSCKDCTQQNSPHPCYLFADFHQQENMSDEHQFFPVITPIAIQELNGVTKKDAQISHPTLICGDGSKTLLAMEFLARSVMEHGETGIFITFAKSTKYLILNSTWSFDLNDLIVRNKISVDFINNVTINDDFNLDDLFVELGCAIHRINAKHVVLDTIESLFADFSDPIFLRSELRRLFEWLKNKGLTVIITGNRDDETYLVHQALQALTQSPHFSSCQHELNLQGFNNDVNYQSLNADMF